MTSTSNCERCDGLEDLIRESEARIIEAVHGAAEGTKRENRERTDLVFAQIEALLELRDMLELHRPMRPTRGWAASPDLLLEIARHIDVAGPGIVVELGSGVSSVVIAAAMRRRGGGRLVSLEHDESFAALTREEIDFQGLSSTATVVTAPLAEVLIRGETWRWYDAPDGLIPEPIDLVFIDGPPGPTGPLARYPALPILYDRLSPNAAIFLDDGARADEQAIISRWQHEFPDFVARAIRAEKGAWLLSRLRRSASPS